MNEGTDTVQSSGSYKLGNNLENLVLTGSRDINGIGATPWTIELKGNAAHNFLVGAAGNDTLEGGAGADKFVFNFRSEGIDIIKDFSFWPSDIIQISTIGLGATSTKELSYNRNTSALSLQGTQFTTLENKSSLIPSLDIELASKGLTS